MATYLYCVRSDALEPPTALVGVDGAPVRAIDAALTAWVSDVNDVAVTPTVERLQAHDAVCAAALEVGETPLPIRFGQAFADDAASVSAIDTRAPALRTRLTRVSGCVELRVVVTHGRETETAATHGEAADTASVTDDVETGSGRAGNGVPPSVGACRSRGSRARGRVRGSAPRHSRRREVAHRRAAPVRGGARPGLLPCARSPRQCPRVPRRRQRYLGSPSNRPFGARSLRTIFVRRRCLTSRGLEWTWTMRCGTSWQRGWRMSRARYRTASTPIRNASSRDSPDSS